MFATSDMGIVRCIDYLGTYKYIKFTRFRTFAPSRLSSSKGCAIQSAIVPKIPNSIYSELESVQA